MNNMIKACKGKLAFIFFLLVYCLSASEWELPASSLLRWISMALMLAVAGLSYLQNDENIFLCSKMYLFIVVAYTIGVFVSGENLFTGVLRAFSFFLLIISLYMYMQRKQSKAENVMDYFNIFAYFLMILMYALTIYYIVSGGVLGEYKGIYSNKNYLVSISCTAVCTSIYLVTNTHGIVKSLSVGSVICSVFITIATGSRAGFICLALGFLLLPFVVMEAAGVKTKFSIVVSLIAIMTVMFIIAKNSNIPALERLLSQGDDIGSTGLSRGDTWAMAFDKFYAHPFVGWGNSAAYYYTFEKRVYGWGIHNSYLMILIDYGIIGSFLHLCFFATIAMSNLKKYRQCSFTKKEKRFVKIVSMICLMLMVNAIAESFLFAVGNIASVCFWLSLVVLDLFMMKKKEET